MLTQYDEYPVHQAAYPFSFIPNTDLCWSDGMYFAIYDREGKYYWYTWMRVYPNTDVVDAFAGIVYDGGRHYSIRLSRQWRPHCDTCIGPLSYTFVKPFREIRLVLKENDYDMTSDVTWIGLHPGFEEMHHRAVHWGKLTTDQTRFTQNGTAQGWIKFRGQHLEVDRSHWWGVRDHSWGVYSNWSPLGFDLALAQQYFPPREQQERERALRMWVGANFEDHSATYDWHESQEAEMVEMNDVFGTPFEGRLDFGWGEMRPPIRLVDVYHDLEFIPGTRILRGGRILLRDERAKQWEHRFSVIAPPVAPQIGAWKDGRPNGHYRGPLTIESDEVDFRKQPIDRVLPDGRVVKSSHGAEYVAEFTERSDEGEKNGWGHIEFRVSGRYARYGFDKEEEVSRPF